MDHPIDETINEQRARRLALYTRGEIRREIIAERTHNKTTRIIDRALDGDPDKRLLAHLAPDEPTENAQLIADMYLAGRTRPEISKLADQPAEGRYVIFGKTFEPAQRSLQDEHGNSYAITTVDESRWGCALAWRMQPPDGGEGRVLTARQVMERVGDLDAVRELAEHAIENREPHVSASDLREQLQRVDQSELVPNQKIREAVLQARERGESVTAIARRSGYTRPDGHGDLSALERRIGMRAESAQERPSLWTNSRALARIVRHGLGKDPYELGL